MSFSALRTSQAFKSLGSSGKASHIQIIKFPALLFKVLTKSAKGDELAMRTRDI